MNMHIDLEKGIANVGDVSRIRNHASCGYSGACVP